MIAGRSTPSITLSAKAIRSTPIDHRLNVEIGGQRIDIDALADERVQVELVEKPGPPAGRRPWPPAP